MKCKHYSLPIFCFSIFFFVFCSINAFGQFKPNQVAGLKLWLRSDSAVTLNGSKVSLWGDCSGSGYNAAQVSAPNQPTFITSVINNKPAVWFDGTASYLSGGIITGLDTSSATVIIVASGDAVASLDVFRGLFTINNLQFCLSWETHPSFQTLSFVNAGENNFTKPLNTPLPYTGFPIKIMDVKKKKGVVLQQSFNNVQTYSNASAGLTSNFTNNNFEIGRNSGSYPGSFKGNIFEILVYNKYLPDSISTKIFQYLSQKYAGPGVNLGADINKTDYCPQILHAGLNFSHYLWNTGDTTESITISQSGNYNVRATNIFGAYSYDTIKVSYPPLVLHDTGYCIPGFVSLSTGLDASYSYQWSDGQTTQLATVNSPGTYWVTVTKNTCSKVSNVINVIADNFPANAWLGNDTSMCSGNSIGLKQPYPPPANLVYHWSTSETSGSISIATSGTYHVTVTNQNGCVARDTININISGTAPAVNFINSNTCSGDSVYFTNTSSPLGNSWVWNFGDGNNSNLENPKHLYALGGSYQVKLIVTSGSCSNELIKTVVIPATPQALFSLTEACIGNPYSFFDQSTKAAGDSITSRDWDFGDLTAHSFVKNPVHTYASSGNYNVVLNIITDKGCSDSYSLILPTVSTAPLPSAVTLNSPQPNALLSSHLIDFDWNIAANAEKYAIVYASDTGFTINRTKIFPLFSGSHQANVTLNGKVYWRVIAYNLCGDSTLSGKRSFEIMSPNQIPGLKLWLRSDSAVTLNGNKVAQWNDCSGNGHNAVQGNSTNQPTFLINTTLNNKPAVWFDGTLSYFTGDTIKGLDTTSATVIIIASGDSVLQSDVFRGFFAINNHQFCMSWQTYSGYQNISFSNNGTFSNPGSGRYLPSKGFSAKVLGVKKKKGSFIQQYINNEIKLTSIAPGLTSNFTNNKFEIGRTSGAYAGYFKGNIFEVLIYDKYLPDSLSTKIFQYLSNKYGGPDVNLGADIIKTDFCHQTIHAGTRFSRYLWNTGDTTESITVDQSGNYYVKAYNIFGAISYDTIKVTYPSIVLHDTILCALGSVSLATGLDASYSFNWSDGQTTQVASVNTPGSYWVTVSKNTCSKVSNVINVVEDSFPVIAWLGNDTSICSGNTIGLIHPYTLPANLVYHWSTSETSASISIDISGTYDVTVTNTNGCIARDTINVNIIGVAPTVNFISSNNCSGDSVQFTNTSSPLGNFWAWDFGDGNNSNLENPKHVYALGGSYQVKLFVTSGSCSNELTKTVIIPTSPHAFFSLTQACIGSPYSFYDQSTTAPGDSITSYDWDFGDLTSHSSAKDPVHIYTTSGNHNIVLNIITEKGCSDSYSLILPTVSTAPLPLPATLIFPQPNAVMSSHTINFEWNPTANAEKYALEYASDTGFTINTTKIFPLFFLSHQANVTLNGKVYWRVIAYNLCGDSTFSGRRSFEIFLPNQISGLKLWLQSDSSVVLNGNKVSQWNDCSGNGHNAIQTISGNQPTLINSVLNNKPGVWFDGSSAFLTGDTIKGIDTTSATVVIVASGDVVTKEDFFRGMFAINNHQFCVSWETYGSYQNLYFSNNGSWSLPTDTALRASTGFPPKVFTVKKNKGIKMQHYFNNELKYSSTPSQSQLTSNFTNNKFEIGRTSGSYQGYFKGNIFEVLIFGKNLPDSVSTDVFNYLSNKYAPPVYLGRDINIDYGMCQTTIDAGGRFVNYQWSTGDTSQIINVTQPGDYSVTVTNVFGQLSYDTIHVNLPFISVSDTSFCLGDTINITPNMGPGYSYLWLPDSVISSSLNVFAPQTYALVVTDTNGCQRQKTFTVATDSFAVIASLGSDKKICKGDYIGLVDGAQQAVSYLWSNGSGNSLLIINDVLGSHPQYSVTVSSNNSCYAEDTINLIVNGERPIVNFFSDSVCFGNPSHFTNMSSVSPPFQIVEHNWNFGDASISTVINPSHLYQEDGYYYVTLSVVTDSGCVNSYTDTAIVFSNPVVSFSPYQGCSGVPISFIDNTHLLIGSINQWNWKFNDSGHPGSDTSSSQNPIYVFDSAGVYNVTVTAISDVGCIDSVEKTVSINKSPSLDFNFTAACAEHPVFYHDQIGMQPWETIITYNWQFGDGKSSPIPNPTHVFDTAGIYTTVFTIRNSTGCEVSVTKPVDVGGVPMVDFIYSNNCIFNNTEFSDNSLITNGIINSWYWNFDGLGYSTIQNPVFIFPDTSVYRVYLTVKTDHNCMDTTSQLVEIMSAPVAQFSISPEYGIPPLSVTMDNNSVGASNYLWSFGDGETSALVSPVHTYQNQGIFKILLNAYNAIGCSDTFSTRVYVLPTTVDIAVVGAKVIMNNGRLSVTADLSNNGTRKIEHIDLAVDFGNGNILHEQWLGSLLEGESMQYEFAVSSEIPKDGEVNFVCVKALLPDLTEESTANNIYCVAMKDEFIMLDPYPNPVKDMINIAYILPFGDQISIDMVDGMGKIIKEIFKGAGNEGYNSVLTDLSTLNSGVYTISISFRDKVLRKKFVKL